MIASIRGSTCPWCQIDTLRAGFRALGYEHTDDWRDPRVSFVFVGNGPYDEYANPDDVYKPLIFNVLDIATQNVGYEKYVEEFKSVLPLAHKVTSISAFTQWQLREYCGIESEVVYYPIKPVSQTNVKLYPQFKAMICGRVNDPNKRAGAAIKCLIKAGYDESEVAIVGPERAPWGTYLGVVDDLILNALYNSVDYVFQMDKIAGLGLPAIEAACVGAIPIVAPDLSTYHELWSSSPMGLYYQTFTSIDKIAETIRYFDGAPQDKADMKAAMKQYADLYLRPKCDAIEVARKILAVYQSI